MVHQDIRPDFGLVGCGRFGSFAARSLAAAGSVRVWDPRWWPDPPPSGPDADGDNPPTLSDGETLPDGVVPSSLVGTCRARAVILAVPIREIPAALDRIRPHLSAGTLVADTASVKVWPCRWLLRHLPESVELVGTHPLFGPDSAADGLTGHKMAVVPLRLRHRRGLRRFLEGFGLEVLETTPEAHDQAMALTQSLVHWIGRGLERLGSRPQAMDTLGYRRLLEVLDFVVRDSWQLFTDLQRWNPYAPVVRTELLRVLRELDREVTPPPAERH